MSEEIMKQIKQERKRQRDKWSEEHDMEHHNDGSLLKIANKYLNSNDPNNLIKSYYFTS